MVTNNEHANFVVFLPKLEVIDQWGAESVLTQRIVVWSYAMSKVMQQQEEQTTRKGEPEVSDGFFRGLESLCCLSILHFGGCVSSF